jgi:asparagine synthase (glutamine-hydrolysing)
MCGVSGLAQRSWSPGLAQSFVAASAKYLARRGPDGFNVKRAADDLLLTQARLSIIDIAGGAQPMGDEDGDIVYNGEIYNYRELTDPRFVYRTKSDTEVLLKGINHEGTAYLDRVDGMFAFAHYDRRRRRLTLARDLFGIKPLYYYADGERIAFSSCLQPLMLLSKKDINKKALADYYLTRACRGSDTIFTDIIEVEPGHAVSFDLDTFEIVDATRWARPVEARRDHSDEAEELQRLEEAMILAVDRHLVADVPVASFLSGGVDSSLVTALAALRRPDFSAFSIGFHDKAYDESQYAAAICRQYRIRHHVKYCDAPEFMTYLAEWPSVIDDVVADPSAVMLYAVAQFARDMGFKVVLSGEGADELFGGYNQYYRFNLAKTLNPYVKNFPFTYDLVRILTRGQSRYVHFADTAVHEPEYYGTGMIFEPYLLREIVDAEDFSPPRGGNLTHALQLDLSHRLPDDMLTRTDRATMHASIEARVPFLTRYVGEVSWGLSENLLIRGKERKYLLKKLAAKYAPHDCIYRPKMGFDLPLARWFREDMKPLMMDTLSGTWQNDYLVPGAMARVIDDHLRRKNDNADKLWAFVLLDANVRNLRAITEKDVGLCSAFEEETAASLSGRPNSHQAGAVWA